MILAQHGINRARPGFELFWIIGDSNADGRGATVPTVKPDTLYVWTGSAFDEVRTQTVSNESSGGPYGSAWQNFATNYKHELNKRVAIVNSASGGSEFYPNGDNNNWYTSGTLYSAALTEIQQAQTALGVSTVKVIVCLGINDARGAQSIANITLGIESLRDRINSDLGTPEIYYVMPGRSDVAFNNARHQHVRRLIANIALDANGHIVSQMVPFDAWNLYDVDDLHLIQSGYDLMGEQIVRYIKNSSISNKHARSVIASFKDDVTAAQKTAINTFFNFFAAPSGTLDALHIYVASTRENAFVDWALVCGPQDLNGGTFTANSNIATNGTSEYIRTAYLQSAGGNRSSNTDFAEFVKIGTRTSTGGAFLFGRSDGVDLARVYQASGSLHCQACDATDSNNAAESLFASNAIYGTARNGTNKMLKKDGSNVISVTQATTGDIQTQGSFLGTSNENGSPHASYMAAEYKAYGLIQLSDVVWADFVTALNTLITAMETP